MVAAILMLAGTISFAQTSVIVTPGLNTIITAMNANPGDTLILLKGEEYVIDQSVQVTAPLVVRGEAYTLDDAEPPALIRMYADPGEAGDKIMFAAAADLTLIDLAFIGFTYDDQQIHGVCETAAPYIDIHAHGCIVQSVNTWMETYGVPGTDYQLHDNIHFNISYVGWDNWGGYGGPTYRGDSITNHSYNNTYFIGGRTMLSAGTGPAGWQHSDHNTYVNTFGETFHKNKHEGYIVTNSIFFNTHLRGYVGLRTVGNDTIWEGDYISYRERGDTLNGDCAVFPHVNDSTGTGPREVVITNNLKYNEQRVLDWNAANDVSTQPFLADPMMYYADRYGWTMENNFMDQDTTSYDPVFEMGVLPDGTFEKSWKQRLDRMIPDSADNEIAWRPGAEPQNEFIWPLPFDFTPTAEALLTAGSDGFPLGDLNWFGKEMVADWEAQAGLPLAIKENKPVELGLMNFPNPFNSTTRIKYNLPVSSHVNMKIYNVTGSLVATLVNETQIAGLHETMFDGANLSRGIYFCQIRAGEVFQVHKMILIK